MLFLENKTCKSKDQKFGSITKSLGTDDRRSVDDPYNMKNKFPDPRKVQARKRASETKTRLKKNQKIV